MAEVDVDKLLGPLGGAEGPAGPDPSAQLFVVEQLAQGTPEKDLGGGKIVPAAPPDWRKVAQEAAGVLATSRDLRAALVLTKALLRRDGIVGFRSGLRLIENYLTQLWDPVYPRLDPDLDNDPLERMNILAELSPVTDGSSRSDPEVLTYLSEAPLGGNARTVKVTLRHILASNGKGDWTDADGPRPDGRVVDGAFRETPPDQLEATLAVLDASMKSIDAIDQFVATKVKPDQRPSMESLRTALKRIRSEVAKRVPGAAPSGGEAEVSNESESEAKGPNRASGTTSVGDIRSTQDVLTTIDRICRYYELNEPSSPVPLLLKRARRLVARSFMDIVKDLSLNSITKVELSVDDESGGASSG